MEAQSIRIAMHDASDGYPISPSRVPLATLRSFSRDVDELIRGDAGEIGMRSVEVTIVEGSLAIETMPISNSDLLRDLIRLTSTEIVDTLNTRRRAVIERWQKVAKSSRQVFFEISAPVLQRSIIVSRETDFRADDADQWVRVERYVRGEVFELGGLYDTNVHIRLPNGKTLLINARKEILRADSSNRLFKYAMVRFEAEYNIVTREYRDARLIEFTDYDRTPDEKQLARLTQRGREAWADVTDAQEWVDSLRGSS